MMACHTSNVHVILLGQMRHRSDSQRGWVCVDHNVLALQWALVVMNIHTLGVFNFAIQCAYVCCCLLFTTCLLQLKILNLGVHCICHRYFNVTMLELSLLPDLHHY